MKTYLELNFVLFLVYSMLKYGSFWVFSLYAALINSIPLSHFFFFSRFENKWESIAAAFEHKTLPIRTIISFFPNRLESWILPNRLDSVTFCPTTWCSRSQMTCFLLIGWMNKAHDLMGIPYINGRWSDGEPERAKWNLSFFMNFPYLSPEISSSKASLEGPIDSKRRRQEMLSEN